MAKDLNKLDKIVLEARRQAEKRAQGYREQALKLFPGARLIEGLLCLFTLAKK